MPTININQTNASETAKGIVEEATQAELNAGTDTGATGARLFAVPSKIQVYLAATYQTISGLFASVMALVLTGFSAGANTAVAATDTLAQALAKFQGQINARSPINSPTFTGTVTTPAIIVSSETADRVAIIDGTKNVKSGDTATYPSLTELSYVKGVTSAIQTQLNALSSSFQLVASASAAASATIDFTGLTSTYHTYMLIGTNIVPATDGSHIYLRTSTDGGATYDAGAGNYRHGRSIVIDNGTIVAAGSTSATEIFIAGSLGNAVGENANFNLFLFKPSNSSVYFSCNWDFTTYEQTPRVITGSGGGVRLAAADVDAIRIILSAGNITSGEFRLYGIKNA